jgi:hypothetical protein
MVVCGGVWCCMLCLLCLFGCVVVWLCGCLVVWLCAFVVVWLCGCVVVWLCGCVVVWLCACVAHPSACVLHQSLYVQGCRELHLDPPRLLSALLRSRSYAHTHIRSYAHTLCPPSVSHGVIGSNCVRLFKNFTNSCLMTEDRCINTAYCRHPLLISLGRCQSIEIFFLSWTCFIIQDSQAIFY